MISSHTVTNFFKNLNKIFLLALVLFTFQQSIQPVYAAGTPLSGYAWSAGIGWISFASQGEATITYGVNLSPVSGNNPRSLSGYAWNPNIGWIQFDPSLSGPGAGDAYGARLDVTTGGFSGWARACGVFVTSCSGSLRPSTELGGWDGWIRFGDSSNTPPYYPKVDSSFNPTRFDSGGPEYSYAWGGNVIGWISLCDPNAGALYCVEINQMTTSCQVVNEVPQGFYGCAHATGCSFVDAGNNYTITWHGAESGGVPKFDLSWSAPVSDSLGNTALTYLDSQSGPYACPASSGLLQSATFTAVDGNGSGQTSTCDAETTVVCSPPPVVNNNVEGFLSDPTPEIIRITSQPLTSAAISSHTSFHSLETSTTTTAFIVSMDSASSPGNFSRSLLNPTYSNVISCRLAPDYLDPLGPGNPSAQFSSCADVEMPLLPLSSSGNEAYFNIRVATSTPNLNLYSPYRVKISASSTCTGDPSDWSGCSDVFKSFLFDYAVGTLNPI